MRHLLFLILAVVTNGILLSQESRTSKDVEFETVEDFISDQEAVRKEKLKYYKSADPNGRYPLAMHQSLWDYDVKLSLPYRHVDSQEEASGVAGKFIIDAFGLSTTVLMHKKFPELAANIMKRTRSEVVGKSMDYDDLYDLALALKKELDTVWARSGNKEYDSLILRAGLANHFSRLSNKHECWLLVEVFHATRNSHDLFVRDFMDHVLRAKKKGPESFKTDIMDGQFYPSSHPMVQESRSLDKKRKLEPNRNHASVAVYDDGLTITEREATFGFKLIGATGRKLYQIEGCSWRDVDDRRVFRALSEASDLIADRVPEGSYLSFEELHLRLGSAANVLQKRFPEYNLVIAIKENRINDIVYSSLYLEVGN